MGRKREIRTRKENLVPKSILRKLKMKKEKKSKKQTSWEELLAAIRSLEEIVTAKEPEDWEGEEKVREGTSESSRGKGKK